MGGHRFEKQWPKAAILRREESRSQGAARGSRSLSWNETCVRIGAGAFGRCHRGVISGPRPGGSFGCCCRLRLHFASRETLSRPLDIVAALVQKGQLRAASDSGRCGRLLELPHVRGDGRKFTPCPRPCCCCKVSVILRILVTRASEEASTWHWPSTPDALYLQGHLVCRPLLYRVHLVCIVCNSAYRTDNTHTGTMKAIMACVLHY